jgi:hypothetical protein
MAAIIFFFGLLHHDSLGIYEYACCSLRGSELTPTPVVLAVIEPRGGFDK